MVLYIPHIPPYIPRNAHTTLFLFSFLFPAGVIVSRMRALLNETRELIGRVEPLLPPATRCSLLALGRALRRDCGASKAVSQLLQLTPARTALLKLLLLHGYKRQLMVCEPKLDSGVLGECGRAGGWARRTAPSAKGFKAEGQALDADRTALLVAPPAAVLAMQPGVQ